MQKKRILSLILCLCLVLSMLPWTAMATELEPEEQQLLLEAADGTMATELETEEQQQLLLEAANGTMTTGLETEKQQQLLLEAANGTMTPEQFIEWLQICSIINEDGFFDLLAEVSLNGQVMTIAELQERLDGTEPDSTQKVDIGGIQIPAADFLKVIQLEEMLGLYMTSLSPSKIELMPEELVELDSFLENWNSLGLTLSTGDSGQIMLMADGDITDGYIRLSIENHGVQTNHLTNSNMMNPDPNYRLIQVRATLVNADGTTYTGDRNTNGATVEFRILAAAPRSGSTIR